MRADADLKMFGADVKPGDVKPGGMKPAPGGDVKMEVDSLKPEAVGSSNEVEIVNHSSKSTSPHVFPRDKLITNRLAYAAEEIIREPKPSLEPKPPLPTPKKPHPSGLSRERRELAKRLIWIYPMSASKPECWNLIFRLEPSLSGVNEEKFRTYCLGLIGEYKTLAEIKDDASKPANPLGGVRFLCSPSYARRTTERVRVLRLAVRALEADELEARSERIKQKQSKKVFGSSWKAGSSDLALLRGVVRYGFGRWNRMRADADLKLFGADVKPGDVKPGDVKPGDVKPAASSSTSVAIVDLTESASPSVSPSKPSSPQIFPKDKHVANRITYAAEEILRQPKPSLEPKKEEKKKKKSPKKKENKSPKKKKVKTDSKPKKGKKRKNETNGVDKTAKKKKKMDTVCPVDRHPTSGLPILPLKTAFRGVTVQALGEVEFRDARWHSDKYIWPRGFESRKTWKSFVNP
eukprot:175509_1